MSFAERMARLSNAFYDRMRHKGAFTIGEEGAVTGPFDSLRGRRYATVVTFRRTGEAMPSPLWVALAENGRVYAHTQRDGGKMKRLRNDDRALIVASTRRGKPVGPVYRATGREVPDAEWPYAEAALAANFGLGRKAYMGAMRGVEALETYLEVSPVLD